jgi:hypothetical protein
MILLDLCILCKIEEYQIIETLLVFSINDVLLLKRFKHCIQHLLSRIVYFTKNMRNFNKFYFTSGVHKRRRTHGEGTERRTRGGHIKELLPRDSTRSGNQGRLVTQVWPHETTPLPAHRRQCTRASCQAPSSITSLAVSQGVEASLRRQPRETILDPILAFSAATHEVTAHHAGQHRRVRTHVHLDQRRWRRLSRVGCGSRC